MRSWRCSPARGSPATVADRVRAAVGPCRRPSATPGRGRGLNVASRRRPLRWYHGPTLPPRGSHAAEPASRPTSAPACAPGSPPPRTAPPTPSSCSTRTGSPGPPVTLTRRQLEACSSSPGRRTLRDVQVAATATRRRPVSAGRTRRAGRRSSTRPCSSTARPSASTCLGPVRRPACIGCYPTDPDAIRATAAELFTGPGGPGLPATRRRPSPTAGCGPCSCRTWTTPAAASPTAGASRNWSSGPTPRLFVIVATSHYSPHRFTLTRKNFHTPLGHGRDRPGVHRPARERTTATGCSTTRSPTCRSTRSSWKWCCCSTCSQGRRPFRIVPLLVGSFVDCVDAASPTRPRPADIARMVAALRRPRRRPGEPVCYVISGDLAHIGPKFGDPEPVTEPQLTASRQQDELILDRADGGRRGRVLRRDRRRGRRRRICGLPPTWLTLAAARPRPGRCCTTTSSSTRPGTRASASPPPRSTSACQPLFATISDLNAALARADAEATRGVGPHRPLPLRYVIWGESAARRSCSSTG